MKTSIVRSRPPHPSPFGNPAISQETRGFASLPHDRFAFIGATAYFALRDPYRRVVSHSLAAPGYVMNWMVAPTCSRALARVPASTVTADLAKIHGLMAAVWQKRLRR